MAVVPLATAQSAEPTIALNGTPVPTTRPVSRVGSEWFVPLVPVARAAGAELRFSPKLDGFKLRRSDGQEITYDVRTGEMQQGAVIIGRVSSYQKVQILGAGDDLLFPLQGALVLLDASAREDRDLNTLLIETSSNNNGGQNPGSPVFSMAGLDYTYGFSANNTDFTQYTSIRTEAILGPAHVTGNLLLNQYPGQSFLGLTQGSFRATFASGQAVIAGDQSGFSGMEALAATVRGIGYERKLGKFDFQAYGGRAAGTSTTTIGFSRPSYDSNFFGINLRRKLASGEWLFGGNFFDGPNRSGVTVGTGYTRLSQKNRFNVQGFMGSFSGLSSRTVVEQIAPLTSPLAPIVVTSTPTASIHVDGAATGFSVSDVYTPFQKLTLSGQYERYSANFLTAREDSRFSGQSSFSVSGNYRLNKYIDFNAGTNDRNYLLGESNTSRGYTYGANFTVPSRLPVQFGYFRSIQQNPDSTLSGIDLSQYSFSLPRWKRYSVFAYFYTSAAGATTAKTFSTSVSADYGRFGQFAFHHQAQFGNSGSFGGNWQLEVPRYRGSILAGIDRYSQNNGKSTYLPYTGLRVGLPRHQSLEFRYSSQGGNSILQFSIGGPLMGRRELVRNSNYFTPAVVIPSHLSGTVYQDMNYNGVFDPTADIPISGLRIILDDGTTATTDAHGSFRFSQVAPGAHMLRAELSQVPADMVLVEGDERTLTVVPRRENTTTFRLVKTGRVKGRVTFSDSPSGSPEDHGAPEIRIVAKGEHDGVSELNGSFLIGDLPPGSYQLRVDPASIPEGLVAAPATIPVEVKPGETAPEIIFRLVVPQTPVIERALPAQRASDLQLKEASPVRAIETSVTAVQKKDASPVRATDTVESGETAETAVQLPAAEPRSQTKLEKTRDADQVPAQPSIDIESGLVNNWTALVSSITQSQLD